MHLEYSCNVIIHPKGWIHISSPFPAVTSTLGASLPVSWLLGLHSHHHVSLHPLGSRFLEDGDLLFCSWLFHGQYHIFMVLVCIYEHTVLSYVPDQSLAKCSSCQESHINEGLLKMESTRCICEGDENDMPRICLVHHCIPLREEMLIPTFPHVHFVLKGGEVLCDGENVSLERIETQNIHYISYGCLKLQS